MHGHGAPQTSTLGWQNAERTHSLVMLRLRPWSSVDSVQFLRTLLQASNSIYESVTHIDERQTNSKSFAAD